MPETLELLVVDDNQLAREALADILRDQGYQVILAESGSIAISRAREYDVRVVLMDIILDEMEAIDGIDAALQIQREHPLTSFIFVSGYIQDVFKTRAREGRLRVGGWVEKPFEIDGLLLLIEKEHRKLQVLAQLHALADLDRSLPQHQQVFGEVLEELMAEDEIADPEPSEPASYWDFQRYPEMRDVTAEIDEIYGQLRILVRERAGDPDLPALAAPLRQRLRDLQEREADALERRFRAELRFDADKAEKDLEWAERL